MYCVKLMPPRRKDGGGERGSTLPGQRVGNTKKSSTPEDEHLCAGVVGQGLEVWMWIPHTEKIYLDEREIVLRGIGASTNLFGQPFFTSSQPRKRGVEVSAAAAPTLPAAFITD